MQGSDRKQPSRDARRVPVMLPYPFPGPFDYRVPPGMDPQPGDVVLVPLNRREEVGVVWDCAADAGVPDRKLKPVAGMIDTPPMLPALRQFVDWVAGYTLSPPGEVMAMALRIVAPGIGAPADRLAAGRSVARGAASPRRGARYWTRWPNGNRARTGELARAAGVGAGVVRGMADAGLLVPAVLRDRAAVRDPGSGASRPDPVARSGSRCRRRCGRRWRRATSPSRCWTA